MASAQLLRTLACTVALAGFGFSGQAAAAEIKLGIVAPLTGQLASEGKDIENAINLAVAEINKKGGVDGNTIATVSADDACDPQQGVTAATKLVSAGVNVIAGGYCSGAVLPTLKIYGDAGVPFVIVGANSTKLIDANPGNAFLRNSPGSAQAVTAVELFKKSGWKKIAIVDEGDAYSTDLSKLTAEAFKQAGGEVVATETVASGEQDFSTVVTNIKSKGADAVFWTAYHAGAALLTKQLRQAGFRGGIALGDGSSSPEYLQIAGSAANGVYMFSPPVLEFLPEAGAFTASYKSAYSRDPGAYAALAYDTANLLADALARAKSTDSKAVIEALKGSDLKGLAGEIKFTDKNVLMGSNFATLVVKGGKWTLAE